ncbi:hypothetical protein OIU78_014868 [Salix suchowensis]|nr:hypothetical protein OIU78_014868 [Salix suchowensis]
MFCRQKKSAWFWTLKLSCWDCGFVYLNWELLTIHFHHLNMALSFCVLFTGFAALIESDAEGIGVKHDCVFGNDLDVDEITSVSEVLQKLNRPILYSVSPGVIPTPVMKKDISGLVNMYRVTGDDWDTWGDVAARFDVPSSSTSGTLLLLIRLVPRACWGGRGLTWICCP